MGKFMNDSYLLIEYTLEGKVPRLEVCIRGSIKWVWLGP